MPLVVYSAQGYDHAMAAAFQKATGIHVKLDDNSTGPLLTQIPPKLGSRRPADLMGQALLLRHLRGVDTRLAVDVTRLLTGSIADVLDQYFDSDALRGLLSVSGVIGMWAGPRSAGTGYVTLHHHIGESGGQAGA